MQRNTHVKLGEHYDLGEHYEMFIDRQIQKGLYATADEAVEDGLRLLEEQEMRTQVLRQALVEGEESGRSEFSLESINEELDREFDK